MPLDWARGKRKFYWCRTISGFTQRTREIGVRIALGAQPAKSKLSCSEITTRAGTR